MFVEFFIRRPVLTIVCSIIILLVFQLQDRGNNEIEVFTNAKDELIARAEGAPELNEVFSTYTANSPQISIDIDRDRAKALQIPISEILNTLQNYIGSRYVNDFNAMGRTYRVYVQADGEFRINPQAIESLSCARTRERWLH